MICQLLINIQKADDILQKKMQMKWWEGREVLLPSNRLANKRRDMKEKNIGKAQQTVKEFRNKKVGAINAEFFLRT